MTPQEIRAQITLLVDLQRESRQRSEDLERQLSQVQRGTDDYNRIAQRIQDEQARYQLLEQQRLYWSSQVSSDLSRNDGTQRSRDQGVLLELRVRTQNNERAIEGERQNQIFMMAAVAAFGVWTYSRAIAQKGKR